MSIKNSLFIISVPLIFLIIESKTFAGFDKKDEEQWSLSALVKKCFNCFLREKFSEDDQELFSKQEFLYEQDSFSFTRDSLLESKIEKIPPEIMWEICYNLPPLDVIRLCLVSKNLRAKIDDNFWESYIKIHCHERGEHSTSAVKIAYAFSLLKNGRIEDAANLGLPKAIRIAKNMRDTKKEKRAENLTSSLYLDEGTFRRRLGLRHRFDYGK